MAQGQGYLTRIGAGLESAFGTGVAITDLIPFTSENLTEEIAHILSDVLKGSAGRDVLDLGPISVTGDLECDVHYTQKSGSSFMGIDLLLAAAMGGTPAYNSGVNTLFLAESPAKTLTLAVNKGVAIWELVSTMIKSFKLAYQSGQPLKTSLNLIAYKLLTAGTTNGSAQFANLAALTARPAQFGDTVFRLDAISGGALTSADSIGLKNATLTFDSNLTDPEHCSPDYSVPVGGSYHSDSRYTLQPVRGGFRDVKLELELPRYQTAGAPNWGTQLETWRAAGTELQFDAVTSMSAGARRVSLLVPRLVIEKIEAPASGPGVIPQKVTCRCLMNGGTNAGGGVNTVMTNSVPTNNKIPEEFQIETKNTTDGRTAAIWT